MEEVELEGEGLLARAFLVSKSSQSCRTYVCRNVKAGLHDVRPPEEEVDPISCDFYGNTRLQVGTLEALVSRTRGVSGSETRPDKPKGRGKEMRITSR